MIIVNAIELPSCQCWIRVNNDSFSPFHLRPTLSVGISRGKTLLTLESHFYLFMPLISIHYMLSKSFLLNTSVVYYHLSISKTYHLMFHTTILSHPIFSMISSGSLSQRLTPYLPYSKRHI